MAALCGRVAAVARKAAGSSGGGSQRLLTSEQQVYYIFLALCPSQSRLQGRDGSKGWVEQKLRSDVPGRVIRAWEAARLEEGRKNTLHADAASVRGQAAAMRPASTGRGMGQRSWRAPHMESHAATDCEQPCSLGPSMMPCHRALHRAAAGPPPGMGSGQTPAGQNPLREPTRTEPASRPQPSCTAPHTLTRTSSSQKVCCCWLQSQPSPSGVSVLQAGWAVMKGSQGQAEACRPTAPPRHRCRRPLRVSSLTALNSQHAACAGSRLLSRAIAACTSAARG